MESNQFHGKSNSIILAKRLARNAHVGMFVDTVSGDKKPQVEHLQEVADLVWASGGTDDEIAAAWLHDSLEDTSMTPKEIESECGEAVAKIVLALTDSDDMRGMQTLERKMKQAELVKTMSDSVKRVKLADQISNVRLMALDPIEAWKVDEIRKYIMGVRIVAEQCGKVSLILDRLFDEEYARAERITNARA